MTTERKLTLIRKVDAKYSLFECGYCGKQKNIYVYNAPKMLSCGCIKLRWTDNDLKILKEHYPNIEYIKSEINKTESAIRTKAKKIKLYFNPTLSLYHQNIPLEIKCYLAGHFDGEGCAAFRKRQTIRVPILMVLIANKSTIELYKKYFNGALDDHRLKVKPNHKKMYRWRCVRYEDIYNFIEAVLPFSIEKKRTINLS